MLKTDYKQDILSAVNTKRKYNMITNDDGTVSFEDVTEYQQIGDDYGAGDINASNIAINNMLENYHILGVAYTTQQEIGATYQEHKMEITPPDKTAQIIPFFDFLSLSSESQITGPYVTVEDGKRYITVNGKNVTFQVGYLALDKARS